MRESISLKAYLKAGVAFMATTATYFFARTSGVLPVWLQWDGATPAQDTSVSELTVDDTSPVMTEVKATQRRLLQTNCSVTVANPIPDQVIEATVEYSYDLSNVFDGDYTQLGLSQNLGIEVPSWLNYEPKLLGSYATPGIAYELQIIGMVAYVADDNSGLQILNISNPTNVTRLGGYNTPGNAYEVQVIGTVAYVADGSSGLQILNVSNPANVTRLGGYDTPGSARGVQVTGLVAYVADYDSGLQILNVGNPLNVTRLGGYDTPDLAYGVQIIGSIAYVADRTSGLHILNVSNQANVTRLGGYDTLGWACGVQVIGIVAYVADGPSGLQILNVSNPAAVIRLGGYDKLDWAFGVQIIGTVAYVADESSGLQILDVSNPVKVIRLGGYDTPLPGSAYGVHVIGTVAYVADALSGLQIIDLHQGRLVGTPTTARVGESYPLVVSGWLEGQRCKQEGFQLTVARLPRRVDTSLTDQSVFPDQTLRVLWDSDILFTDVSGDALQLSVALTPLMGATGLATSLVLRPTFVGGYDTPSVAQGVQVIGMVAYVADSSSGMQILDVSNPAAVTWLGGYNTPDQAFGVQVIGQVAYVADGVSGLLILNVSNPANVTQLGIYNTTGLAYEVQVIGPVAYVADYDAGLQILNVSNPANVSRLGGYDTPGNARGVQVIGAVAYVADDFAGGLQILNVTNPAAVTRLGGYDTPGWAYGVQVIGTVAYVADHGMGGLQILNVSNPAAVNRLGNYNTPGNALGVQVTGTVAYVADDHRGLQILDVSNPANVTWLGGYDAPGNVLGVHVTGTVAYVAEGISGLQILDLTTWEWTVSPTTAEVGNYEVTLTATNVLGGSVSDSFLLRVEGPPQFRGVIPQQYAKVDQAFSYSIPQNFVTDPNLDSLSFSARLNSGQALPSWLSFNGVSASFAGTPDSSNVGLLSILLSVTDNIAGTTNTTMMLYVDHAPIINHLPETQAMAIGRPFSFAIPADTFVDRDQDALLYDARSAGGGGLPGFLSLNRTTGIFSGLANSTQAGSYLLTVIASDPYGGQASTNLPLVVEYFPTPQLSLPSALAGVGRSFDLPVASNSFYDADDLSLSYTAALSDGRDLPLWLSFNRAELQFSGVPGNGDIGRSAVRVMAHDPVGGYGFSDFNLTVTHFPVLVQPVSPLVFAVDEQVNWTVPANTFSDADGETLAYQLVPQAGSTWPAGLSFDPVARCLSGSPNVTSFAQYGLTLSATDPWGASSGQNITLTIEHRPELQNPVTHLTAGVGQPFSWTAPEDLFVDRDQDPLQLAATPINATTLPAWFSFYPPTATLSGIPAVSDIGQFALRLTATDPFGGSAFNDMTIGVSSFPEVVGTIGTLPTLRADKPVNLIFSTTLFQDLDDPVLIYDLRTAQGGRPAWMQWNASRLTLTGVPTPGDVGRESLNLVAIDSQGGEAAAPFELVIEPNYAPEMVTPLLNPVAQVLEEFRFYVPPATFIDRNNDILTYRASRSDGGPLPSWLRFDAGQQLLHGTPGRSDTGALTDAYVDVAIIAQDDQKQGSAPCRITVSGNSHLEIFLKVGLPLLTAASLIAGLYRHRALLINRCRKHRYEALEQKLMIGQPFEYSLETPKAEVAKIQVKLPRAPLAMASRLFHSIQEAWGPSRDRLPGGALMPAWMVYDTDKNMLRAKTVVPTVKYDRLVVQVKNHQNITVEQFSLKIEGMRSLSEFKSQTPTLDEEAVELTTIATI